MSLENSMEIADFLNSTRKCNTTRQGYSKKANGLADIFLDGLAEQVLIQIPKVMQPRSATVQGNAISFDVTTTCVK